MQPVLIIGLSSFLLAVFGLKFTYYLSILKNPADRIYYLAKLKHAAFDSTYQGILDKGLERVAGIFGVRLFGGQAFLVCWWISFVYSISLFLLSWLWDGSGNLAGVEVLNADVSVIGRGFVGRVDIR